ncbi:hypothetical protein [Streptomyces sp. NPDC056169]|uniref:hypothetical protein n=1 Tax=Streptomyces sp. NPDC056169 TaxID=3345734 RepID=UPI0035DCDEB9
MADEQTEEALRTALGMTSAVLRKDSEGMDALWAGAEDPERTAWWLTAVAAVAVTEAAHYRGMTPQEWLDDQIRLFRKRQ